MPGFQVANNKQDIDSLMQKGRAWVTVEKYHEKNKIVDGEGKFRFLLILLMIVLL